MASREAGKRVFDFAAMVARVPASARADVTALRNAYLAVQSSLAKTVAQPEPIDWAHYKSVINATGYVDEIKKAYDSIKVEYPADTVSDQISQEQKAAETEAQQVIAKADARIAELKAQLESIKSEKPVADVTVDEFLADKPEWQREIKAEIAQHKYQ